MSRISLNGYVVSDDDRWLYDWFSISAFSPSTVREAISELVPGETLTVELNSYGGSVYAGFEMYSLLRGCGHPTVAEVQSIAASAASTVMCGCEQVMISPVGQIMIHMPSTSTYGNQSDHRDSIKVLDSITQSILNGYETKSDGKAERSVLEQLMAEETWLTAQEAIDLGLADGLLGEEQDDRAARMGAGIYNIVNAAGGVDREQLLAEYERRVRDGAAPAEGHAIVAPVSREAEEAGDPTGKEPDDHTDDWRANARLFIEKERYHISKEENAR